MNSTKKISKFFIKRYDANFEKFREAWHLVRQDLGIDIETLLRGVNVQ